ncbi:hypothetical protein MTR_2g083770 [Medicago truncatula]|uniref:Uncharacterized protein n=1 Tax=Medicago truncatula TaxID=3880 RepID=G7IM62_MEDTR|nr:hypothetical protein MTR_2g083770 [Medicago truncatula]
MEPTKKDSENLLSKYKPLNNAKMFLISTQYKRFFRNQNISKDNVWLKSFNKHIVGISETVHFDIKI